MRVEERELSVWERQMVEALAAVEAPGGDVVRESIPHLVVTGVCECGCPSFNVRDRRHPVPRHQLGHFSNGLTPDWEGGFVLWTGPDGRPIAVDAVLHDGGPTPPDPSRVVATQPSA